MLLWFLGGAKMTELTKVCTKCGEEKVVSAFGKHSAGKLGRQSRCSQCQYEYLKEYAKTKEGSEKTKEYFKEYFKTRRKTDYKFRIRNNISNLLRTTYKRYSTKGRQVSSSSIFTQEAMDHLIATKPTDGLKYHIDHIIPISAFNVDDVEHLKLAHVKENLRWLEASANMSKNDSIDWTLIESYPKLTEIAKIIGLKKNLDIAA